MSSYWLLEPHEPLRAHPREGTVDVAIVGGGITGLACALTLARGGRSVRVHEAREVASGASGRNGGFALRGGAMAYDVAREWMGADAARSYWRWTEDALARMLELGGDAFEPVGSLRLAADEEERDEIRREYDALVEDGFAAEWRDELPGGSGSGSRLPSSTPATPRCSRRGGCGGWPCSPRRQGPTSASTTGWTSLDALDADRVVVATDGYPSGLLGELEGLDHPDPRPDDRDRATRRARLRVPALRPPRLRLLAADAGRPRPRRRLPRLRARHRVHGRRDDDRADPGGARAVRRGRGRATGRGRAPLGRHLRARPRLPAGRRPASPTTTASGSPAATPGTATCSASPAARRSGARCSARTSRCSTCSGRTACSPPRRERRAARCPGPLPAAGLRPRRDRAGPARAHGRRRAARRRRHPRRRRATTASRPGA